jgi:hypothetical protein
MTTPAEQLAQIEERYSDALAFVRLCPFGLVGEHHVDDDVSLLPQYTYCVISWHPSLPTTALLPGLIRLKAFVQHDQALGSTEETISFHEELIWFYAYARAQAITGLDHRGLLPPGIARRWNHIVTEILAKTRLSEIDLLRLSILVGYGSTGSTLLLPLEHPLFRDAWLLAKTSNDFPTFLSTYRHIGGPHYGAAVPHTFSRLNPPKKRVALHTCYGRRSGILATTNAPWVGGATGIHNLHRQTFTRPLLYENHDMDRPVGLISNPHISPHEDGELELHADVLIINESHWKRRDEFNGFSLGLQHE